VPETKNEQLYLRDCLMNGISKAAVVADTDQRPQNKINMHNVICRNSPLLVQFREGGKELRSPDPSYVVKTLSSGLQIENAASASAARVQRTDWERAAVKGAAVPALPAPDVPALPPQDQWANILELGAKGDGTTDDTAVFKNAIAEHRVIYIPMGKYVINDTLELKPDTMLIGLHCMHTLFAGAGGAEFSHADAPKAMFVTPEGGSNFITGLGWQTVRNPGTIHLKWRSGARSCLDDAFFSWGGSSSGEGAKYGLWVEGGGGTFRNIWTPNNHASNGWYVSNTAVPGRAYLISVEHHTTLEVLFENVRNWLVCDLQTEIITSGPATPGLVMNNCRDDTFVNLYLFRAGTKERFAYGAKLTGCHNVTFLGIHTFTWGSIPYDNSVVVTDTGVSVPEKEIGRLTIR
jgi:polygalacturonase